MGAHRHHHDRDRQVHGRAGSSAGQELSGPSTSRFVPAIVAGVAALALVAIGWRCPIQIVSGHPCPTCGVTRAVRLALRGDLAGAMQVHPLWWLAVPVATGFIAVEVLGYARTRAWGASSKVRGSNAVMLVTASLLFALWIARFAGYFGGPVQ